MQGPGQLNIVATMNTQNSIPEVDLDSLNSYSSDGGRSAPATTGKQDGPKHLQSIPIEE